MMHKQVFKCLHRSLCDIMETEKSFGGLIVLLGGDFRQVLPVIRHGREADIVESNLKRSFLWQEVQLFHLTIYMRALMGPSHQNQSVNDFQTFLLSIGDGRKPINADVGKCKIRL